MTTIESTPMILQASLEEECRAGSVAKYRDRLTRLSSKDQASLLEPIQHLIRCYIDPVSTALVEWVRERRKAPGRKALALPVFEDSDPDVLALLALKTMLDRVARAPSYQAVCVTVGKEIENEFRFRAFEDQNSPLYKRINSHISENVHGWRRSYRQGVMAHATKKFGIIWEPWAYDKQYLIGSVLADLVIQKTGLFEVKLIGKVRRQRLAVYPTQACLDWLDKQHARCEAMLPMALPMLCAPLPFTVMRDGGYISPRMRRPLVRSQHPSSEFTAASMPKVFKAINALQATPWEINQRVRDVVLHLWEIGADVPEAATRTDLPLPEKPSVEDKEAFRLYKIRSREIHYANVAMKGRRLAVSQTLAIARRMGDGPIWFPSMLDFRGRIYSVPQYLTPQGSDLAKGLIRFNKGVPLGERGLWWLKVHAANCFGIDKVDMQARVKWAEENADAIVQVAEDPYSNRWWHEADKPCQFLAACFELGGATPESVSRLPIWVDGSCNGIQHLSALSRDANSGSHVNLLQRDKPSDIYATVSHVLLSKLQGSSDALASLWLTYGINRSICKRPTMITPYNGTRMAMETYIDLYVTEQMVKGIPHPFGSERKKAVRFLATMMWEAIGEVIDGPRKVMQWTRAVASVVSKSQQPLVWTTPSGFTVRQSYVEQTRRRVQTRLGDRSVALTLTAATDKLDSRRQAQALAPNWIHSLDAAALHLTICALVDQGITDIAAVHDSYGTHAANMDIMARTLREQFVGMYRDDLLGKFLEQVGRLAPEGAALPPTPAKGELDINSVLQSEYFFA